MKDISNNKCRVVNGQLRWINPQLDKFTVPQGVDVIFLDYSESLALETLTLPILSQKDKLVIYDCAGEMRLETSMSNLRKIIVPSGLRKISLCRYPVFGKSLKNVVIEGIDCDIGELIFMNQEIESVTFPLGYKYIDKLPRKADLKNITMVINDNTDFDSLNYPYFDLAQRDFWSMLKVSVNEFGNFHWNNLKNAEEVNIEFDSEKSFIECISSGNFLKLCTYLKLLAKKYDKQSKQYANVKYRFVCKDNSNNKIIGLLNDIYKNVGYSISVFESIIRYLFGRLDNLNIALLETNLERIKSRTSQVDNFGLAVKSVLSSLSDEDKDYIPLDDNELGGFKIFLLNLHGRILDWFNSDHSCCFENKIKCLCLETLKKLLEGDESIQSIIDQFSGSLLRINKEVLDMKNNIYVEEANNLLCDLPGVFTRTRKHGEEQ